MLTTCVEAGKVKCAEYFPADMAKPELEFNIAPSQGAEDGK